MSKGKSSKPKGNGRPAADKKPPGCYVLSLSVQNVRCFGEKTQTLDCSDGNGRPRQWTVILGDNGSGKTTLLQAMVFHSITKSTNTSTSETADSADVPEDSFFLGEIFSLRRSVNTGSESRLCWTTQNWHSPRVPESPPFTPLVWRLSASRFSCRVGASDDALIEFVGYGAMRAQVALTSRREHFGDGVRTLLSSRKGLPDCEEWLCQLDYSAKLDDGPSQQKWVDQIRSLLVVVLPGVEDMRFYGGRGVFPQPRVEFKTDYGWVPLRRLGHGYQTMITWVVDFVSRMVERYPDSENPLAEPAVCLVDEIDLHLHPVWQRKVIGYLSERFPNTQFIVTAHSPLVVQAAASADANIAVLVRSEEKDADGNHYVEIRNNPEDVRNWRLDQILTSDLFGRLSLNPPKVEDLFKEKEHLVGLKRLKPEQKARLAEIEAELAKLPVGDDAREVKEMQAIRDALNHLQKPAVK